MTTRDTLERLAATFERFAKQEAELSDHFTETEPLVSAKQEGAMNAWQSAANCLRAAAEAERGKE